METGGAGAPEADLARAEVDEPDDPQTDEGPAGRRVRSGAWLLLALTAALTAIRAVAALRAEALTSLPDEIGFLGNAWLFGQGEPAPPMGWAPFYPATYGLLLSPAARLTDDTATLATAARLVDVALLALLAPLCWALLGRMGRLRPGARAVAAVAATAVPGMWVAGLRAWPDALLAVVWVSALLALWALASPGPLWRRVWFGPTIALAGAIHARFLPVVVLAAALLLLRVVSPARDRMGVALSRIADVVNLVGLVAVVAVGRRLDAAVEERWDRIAESGLDRLRDDPGATLRHVPAALVGESWYALVGTVGLAGVGAVTLASVAWRSGSRRRVLWTEPVPLVAAAAVLGAVAVQVAAAVQIRAGEGFLGVASFDLLANGRYQEVVLVPLVGVGIARLARRQQGPMTLETGVGAVGVVLAVAVGIRLGTGSVVIDEATAAGTTWLLDVWPDRPTVAPTVLMLVVLWACVVLRPRPRRPGDAPSERALGVRAVAIPVVALVALSAPGIDRARHVVADSEARAERAPDLRELHDALDGRPVAYALDASTLGGTVELGWELAREGMVTWEPGEDPPPEPLVVAPGIIGWDLVTLVPAVPGLAGAEPVVELPLTDSLGRTLHLWELPEG